ncbi:MAG: hypothetical protein CAF45_006855 [Nitrospira sp. CG24E]|nr:MAG: hypothetical protein CAF45_006855 [Nitrospira sp. CG24E]
MLLRYIRASLLLACVLIAPACDKSEVQRSVSRDSLPQSLASQTGDRRVLAGEWEYVDEVGAVDHLKLDGEGNGRYDWKEGRFETSMLIGHTWQGIWIQKENDRDGGFTVEFSPDFSEGEGRWWYSRIGTDYAPTQKGGTFHLRKKTARANNSRTPRNREKFLTP